MWPYFIVRVNGHIRQVWLYNSLPNESITAIGKLCLHLRNDICFFFQDKQKDTADNIATSIDEHTKLLSNEHVTHAINWWQYMYM